MTRGGRRTGLVAAALTLAAACAAGRIGPAHGSQLIDRNATDVSLQLNAGGEALLSYRAHGLTRHVLVWGAVNAAPPSEHVPQVAFQLDYSGGYEKYFKNNAAARELASEYAKIKGTPGYLANPIVRKLREAQRNADLYWQNAFHGGCGPYHGPSIAWAVLTCTAPDGSFWAVQQWQRELPDYGEPPGANQSVWELRISHWTGQLPQLTVQTDWAWHRWDHLFGRLTYLGQPVFGFHSTGSGNPLDSYGRNVYLDTYDSAYGSGWRRENSVLTHRGTGIFCYSVNPHAGHQAGKGTRYRVTVIGPGVTPDVMWEGSAPGPYNAAADRKANQAIAALHDNLCRPN